MNIRTHNLMECLMITDFLKDFLALSSVVGVLWAVTVWSAIFGAALT